MCLEHNEQGTEHEMRFKSGPGAQHLGLCRLLKESEFHLDYIQMTEEVLGLLVAIILVVALIRDKNSDSKHLSST